MKEILPEKADFIGTHNLQITDTEEIELLEKLENGDLIAIVTSATFSKLPEQHCVEHFVFCHPVLGFDEFFKRCQPAFTSVHSAYLHLIYNSTQDFQDTIEELDQMFPDREALIKLYREMRKLKDTKDGFVDMDNVNNELDIAKVGIETGLTIFEELGFIERNKEGIKLLLDVATKELNKSETYFKGEKLKREITEFQAFQLEHSIEQIWEKILENVSVNIGQMLNEQHTRIPKIIDDSRPVVDYEQDVISPPISNVWPQRGISSFNSLRQLAAKKHSESNTILCEEEKGFRLDKTTRSMSLVGLIENNLSPKHDYQNKYNLAMQFAEEHGFSALEQGIEELIQEQDDPDYDFTEDETKMLQAFQDALKDFQKQLGESSQELNSGGKEQRTDSEDSEFGTPIRNGDFGELFAGKPVPLSNDGWIQKSICNIGVLLYLNKHNCYTQLLFTGDSRIERRDQIMKLFPESDYTWEYRDSPKEAKVRFPVLDKGKNDRDDWDEIREKLVTMGTDIYNKIRESGSENMWSSQ
ncbi:MAG: hypothetical protein OXU23_11290 [Candidatus Poribacteria bacterium]|nr:hypothetical protein [Candidatus Poribacteria bacterium]